MNNLPNLVTQYWTSTERRRRGQTRPGGDGNLHQITVPSQKRAAQLSPHSQGLPAAAAGHFHFSKGLKEPPPFKNIRTLLLSCIFSAFVPFLVFVAQHFVTLVWKSAVVDMSASVSFCSQMCNSSACAYPMREHVSGFDALPFLWEGVQPFASRKRGKKE